MKWPPQDLLGCDEPRRECDFAEFDAITIDLLRRGLQGALIRGALAPGTVARKCHRGGPRAPTPAVRNTARLRTANRTDALRDEPAHRAFGHRTLDQVNRPGLATVITAAGPAIVIPVLATAETLAKMAAAIGVGADELAAAGREDAGGQLRSATRQQMMGERRKEVVSQR